jgi:hypothetical protein
MRVDLQPKYATYPNPIKPRRVLKCPAPAGRRLEDREDVCRAAKVATAYWTTP